MSMDYFSIGMEEINKASQGLVIEAPENAREIPCDSCAFAGDCEEKMLECVAIRNWYRLGDFEDQDVGRLRRVMKFN